MSVHQLCWWTTLQVISKCLRGGSPNWLFEQLEEKDTCRRGSYFKQQHTRLSLSEESLWPKAISVWKNLLQAIRDQLPAQWKPGTKKLIKDNVTVKSE